MSPAFIPYTLQDVPQGTSWIRKLNRSQLSDQCREWQIPVQFDNVEHLRNLLWTFVAHNKAVPSQSVIPAVVTTTTASLSPVETTVTTMCQGGSLVSSRVTSVSSEQSVSYLSYPSVSHDILPPATYAAQPGGVASPPLTQVGGLMPVISCPEPCNTQHQVSFDTQPRLVPSSMSSISLILPPATYAAQPGGVASPPLAQVGGLMPVSSCPEPCNTQHQESFDTQPRLVPSSVSSISHILPPATYAAQPGGVASPPIAQVGGRPFLSSMPLEYESFFLPPR